jgi:thiamine-phosphate pyrophosphorylase
MNLNSRNGDIRRLKLATRLARQHLPAGLPPALILTDPWRSAPPEQLAQRMPPGWGLVYRHFGAPERFAMAERLAKLAFRGHFTLLIGADPRLAAAVGADGVHWPEACLLSARRWTGRFRLMTASAHSVSAVCAAQPRGIDARVLSTVFPSASPTASTPMGRFRFRKASRDAACPIYALGGITGETAPAVSRWAGLAGVGKIE